MNSKMKQQDEKHTEIEIKFEGDILVLLIGLWLGLVELRCYVIVVFEVRIGKVIWQSLVNYSLCMITTSMNS